MIHLFLNSVDGPIGIPSKAAPFALCTFGKSCEIGVIPFWVDIERVIVFFGFFLFLFLLLARVRLLAWSFHFCWFYRLLSLVCRQPCYKFIYHLGFSVTLLFPFLGRSCSVLSFEAAPPIKFLTCGPGISVVLP